MFHTKAWTLWLVAALLPFMLTRNPFYLLPAMGAVILDYLVLCRTSAQGHAWRAVVWLGASLALFSVLYNVLFVSAGFTKLVTLPALRITSSDSVLQIGGAITLESLTYGLLQALSLIGIILVFATFNARADHYELLRGAPRFLYQSAIVLSIAVTFVPQLMVAQAEIRQAQRLRGHRFRARRDLLPLFVILLAEGLESSITLAESMSARGFGGAAAQTGNAMRTRQVGIAVGLFLILVGVVGTTYFPKQWFGLAVLAVGLVFIALVLWRIGAGVQVSRYRRALWLRHDTLLVIASVLVIAVFAGVQFFNPDLLIFYPYPRLKLPEFDPLVLLSVLLLAAPALIVRLKLATSLLYIEKASSSEMTDSVALV